MRMDHASTDRHEIQGMDGNLPSLLRRGLRSIIGLRLGGTVQVIHDATGSRRSSFWITGNASPYQLYCDGCRHSVEYRQQMDAEGGPGLLVIDDCDDLLRNKTDLDLLKAYCQTDDEKLIGWHTASKQLVQQEIPCRYHNEGRVAVISL
jgi:hypothetical protein